RRQAISLLTVFGCLFLHSLHQQVHCLLIELDNTRRKPNRVLGRSIVSKPFGRLTRKANVDAQVSLAVTTNWGNIGWLVASRLLNLSGQSQDCLIHSCQRQFVTFSKWQG